MCFSQEWSLCMKMYPYTNPQAKELFPISLSYRMSLCHLPETVWGDFPAVALAGLALHLFADILFYLLMFSMESWLAWNSLM